MKNLSRQSIVIYLILIGIGVISFLPRLISLDAHWSSDETLWLNRSRFFISSIKESDFQGTLQSHHPGVPTMWLAGTSLWTKYRGNLSAVADEVPGFLSPTNLARCRLMIAVVTGIIILIVFFMIRRLLGTKMALFTSIFLALDPAFLAQSRRLHTDALATSFLLLSILTLIVFLQDFKGLRHLILSGICFGIACLSKSYVLIGLCYFPLLMLAVPHSHDSIWIGRSFWISLTWLAMACLTFVCGWPVILSYGVQIGSIQVPFACLTAIVLLGMIIWGVHKLKVFMRLEVSDTTEMWKDIQSGIIIGGICFGITAVIIYNAISPFFEGIGWALITEHEVPHFFLGKIRNDPGWLFYPLMLSIESAPLTLPLSLIGFVFLWKNRHHSQYVRTYQIYAVLAIFVILFTFCMSIGAKKMSRYLLPVFPILDVLAAIAVSIFTDKKFADKKNQIEGIKRRPFMKTFFGRNLKWLAVGVIVLIQVHPVLTLHPHYGTYYNPLWKATDITKVYTIGGAYGLDLAADYLNQKTNAHELTVRVSPLSVAFFGHYFKGKSYGNDSEPATLSPDYEVAYIRDVQIDRIRLSEIKGTLEHIIRLNGIDYVWIYHSSPSKE